MKKNGTRLLSLLLILTMVLSFAPTAFAAETEVAAPEEEESYGSSWGDWEDWENTDPEPAPVEEEQPAEEPAEEIVEEPAAEEEPALVEEAASEEEPVEVSYPANTFFYVGGSGLRVVVEAPEGAFPADAEMTVNEVRPDAVQGVVANAGVSGNVLIAADISFRDAEGNELEPEVPVEVAVTASLPKANELKVVHIDDYNNVEEVNQLPVGENASIMGVQNASDARTLKFEAKSFSVYAVVEEGDTGDRARATVSFWKDTAKSENRATVYVKNSDTVAELGSIIYDPGVGTLAAGEVFRGWTDDPDYTAATTPKTVATIRSEMAAMSIAEGDVVDYYAMIFKIYNIAFQDEYGATVKTDKLYIRADGEQPSYTIREDYVPSDPNKKFEGWFVGSGSVSPEQTNYPVGTTVQVASDVVFTVNAPTGAWLSFNENGRGASYTPPQFVPSGSTTSQPANPTRRGYTFGGWYTGAPSTSGGDPTGSVFTFGGEITQRTDLYAKWNPVTTAPYTVIIWKQRATDDKNAADDAKNYDVWQVVTGLEGPVGQAISAVTQTGSNVNTGFTNPAQTRNIVVNGTQYSAAGFHCDRYDSGVTIAPEGNTVLNVYYDRNLITLNFTTGNGTYRNYYFNVGDGRVRTATMTGLFDAEIDFAWPSVGYSNATTTTTTNILWSSQRYNGNLTFYGSYKLRTETDVNDTYTMTGGGNNIVYFYRQNSDGTWPATNGYSNLAYVSDGGWGGTSFTLTNKYAGFTLYKYKSGAFVQADNNQWSTATPEQNASITNGRLNIRFTRDKYPITYLDGTYFDGNGTVLQEASTEEIRQTDPIYYEADISYYGEGGSNYFVPGVIWPGYTFSGWYVDQTCTRPATFDKMPQGGVTVYAKWVQTQYRVFLHPNVPETQSLVWGQTNQQMNFRVTAGEKISGGAVINGDRENRTYELIGWFTDPSLSNSSYFNFDTVLNDDTVSETPAYDKTTDFTDTMNKYGRITDAGSNSDVNRPWITRKFELWAKWREILPGAKGINVVYDPMDGYGEPNDTQQYLDNSDSIAQGASVPNDSTKQFVGWVLQTWNGSEYVDKTGDIINPGDPFTVLKADAKQEPRIDEETGEQMVDEDGNKMYIYTVQLRAEYQEFEAPEPTHITWYSNVQTVDGMDLDLSKFTKYPTDAAPIAGKDNDKGYFVTDRYIENELDLQINEAVDIRPADTFTYGGLTFLGWAKKADATESELFLKYVDGKFYAQETEGTGDWTVEVTQVAADERRPYDDLYAVWSGEFYVYHSGVVGGNIETVKITSADMTYDLTQNITANTLYGGYYLDDGVTAPAVDSTTGKPTATCAAYDGDNWTWNTPETAKGNAITPVIGATYYIKEVPANKFLRPYTHYTYILATGTIGDIFAISAIDDAMYSKVGFVITDPKDGKVVTTLTIKNERGGNSKTLSPDTVFAKRNLTTDDFLTYLKATDFIEEGYTVSQFWVTPDGATVNGSVVRTLTGIDNKSTIGATNNSMTIEIKW